MKSSNSKRGYTLLFAVLTASLVLGVAAFTVGVARKQYILASTARDSIFSFYNADSAISCITNTWSQSTSSGAVVNCNNNGNISLGFSPDDNGLPWPSPTTFNGYDPVYKSVTGSFEFGSNGGCAVFTIWVGAKNNGEEKSVMEARGYNVCSSNGGNIGPLDSSRTVERAIRITSE